MVKGYGDAVVGIGNGAWFVARHPIQAAKGVGNAIRHPIQTAGCICDEIYEKSETYRGTGEVVGEVLLIFVDPTKGFRVVKAASKVDDAARLPTIRELVRQGAPDSASFALSAPDAGLVRTLRSGLDVEVPAGRCGIRTMMSDVTLATGNEVALLRMVDGRRVLRMGGSTSVPLSAGVRRVIAHTHPSGRLKFSEFDIRALRHLGQRCSVIIDPNANMGARLGVPGP